MRHGHIFKIHWKKGASQFSERDQCVWQLWWCSSSVHDWYFGSSCGDMGFTSDCYWAVCGHGGMLVCVADAEEEV